MRALETAFPARLLAWVSAGAIAFLIGGCDLNPPPEFVPLGEGCDTCPSHTRCVEDDEGVRCIPHAWESDAQDELDGE